MALKERIRAYNPDIYTTSDAKHFLDKVDDQKYVFGSDQLDPTFAKDQAKIYSLPPQVYEKLTQIVKGSGHVQPLPFVMGTYNINRQEMRMNDFSMTDPYAAYLLASGGLEGFGYPFLRGIYFASRRSWWRHESTHAQHHLTMTKYLYEKDVKDKRTHAWHWGNKHHLDEAGYTIHESGVEELMTRWQSFKEARGKREKAVSTASLLLYLEYAPFTGFRNLLIDGKAEIDRAVDGGWRTPAKVTSAVILSVLPYIIEKNYNVAGTVAQAISDVIPVTAGKIEGAIDRGYGYYVISIISALLSTKEKGAFEHKLSDNDHVTTNDYKFPYTYNPATSLTRSVGLLRYLNTVWEEIPSYREVKSTKGIDKIQREIDDKLSTSKLNSHQHGFTMDVVEDALDPFRGGGRSQYPKGLYIKGMFVPAMYLNLKELFSQDNAVETFSDQISVNAAS